MYYSDYHMHTQLSDDSHATLEQQCRQAISLGIKEVCVTDHWNLVDQGGNLRPKTYPWEKTRALILDTRNQFFGQLDIRMGIELGNAMIDLPAVGKNLPLGQLDFVIGSLHNTSTRLDAKGIYTLAHVCTQQEECKEIMDDYIALTQELVDGVFYDVLGHIIYPLRYFPKQFNVSLRPYWDQVAEIFKTVIAKGKGIEVNTSQGATVHQWKPLLELYHDLGGEIITTGADAHFNDKVGAGILDATQLIADCGFKYTTTYRQRVPHFVKIG